MIMETTLRDSFLQLVRLGIGTSKDSFISNSVDWSQLKTLADEQGLSAIILDALNTGASNLTNLMPLQFKLEWIGEVMQNYEQRYKKYEKAIGTLADFYGQHGFKMMVLKGYVCSLNWPKPDHRPCGDIDTWNFGKQKEADFLIKKELGITIDEGHHIHTVFEWQGFTVENHYDLVNTYRHKNNVELNNLFKKLAVDDSNTISIDGHNVYCASVQFNALFLISHALAHFAASEINLRQILDWAFFVNRHHREIDWDWLIMQVERFHMKSFFDNVNAICVEDLGFNKDIFHLSLLSPICKERVLDDIIYPRYTGGAPKSFLRRLVWKWRRWKGNSWKRALCYQESNWSSFCSSFISHLAKPSTI